MKRTIYMYKGFINHRLAQINTDLEPLALIIDC